MFSFTVFLRPDGLLVGYFEADDPEGALRDLGKIEIKPFADKEIGLQIGENVRGCDVFLVQSCCTPVNGNALPFL